MSDNSNKGGIFKGNSHANGGIDVVVKGSGQQIEVEGQEPLVPSEALQDTTVYQYTGNNFDILNKINKSVGAKGLNKKATEVHAGDVIICKATLQDKSVKTLKGTHKQIISAINSEAGCNVIEEGGTITKNGKTSEYKNGGTAPKEYSEKELKLRAAKKKESIGILSKNVNRLRNQVNEDLKSEDEKYFLTALVVYTMFETCERVGNGESESNGHYGVTGFKKSHVKVNDGTVEFKYRGKSGVDHTKTINNQKLAELIQKAFKKSPSKKLFVTSDGFEIKNDRINRYLSPFNITAKDIRGYSANKLIVSRLKRITPEDSESKRKRQFNDIVKIVAEKVGHTPATLKKHYMLPDLEQTWMQTGHIIDLNTFHPQFKDGGEVDKDGIYSEWKNLINVPLSKLKEFYDSEEGKKAGLSKKEADRLKISSGRESARWIMRMKETKKEDWTPKMWEWAKKQISFVKRMSANPGELFDEKGHKTRKHTALLIWGHDPLKKPTLKKKTQVKKTTQKQVSSTKMANGGQTRMEKFDSGGTITIGDLQNRLRVAELMSQKIPSTKGRVDIIKKMIAKQYQKPIKREKRETPKLEGDVRAHLKDKLDLSKINPKYRAYYPTIVNITNKDFDWFKISDEKREYFDEWEHDILDGELDIYDKKFKDYYQYTDFDVDNEDEDTIEMNNGDGYDITLEKVSPKKWVVNLTDLQGTNHKLTTLTESKKDEIILDFDRWFKKWIETDEAARIIPEIGFIRTTEKHEGDIPSILRELIERDDKSYFFENIWDEYGQTYSEDLVGLVAEHPEAMKTLDPSQIRMFEQGGMVGLSKAKNVKKTKYGCEISKVENGGEIEDLKPTVSKQGDTTYTTHKIKIGKTEYSVLVAEGGYNYVSIRKETNNPFKTAGQQFKNFDEAIAHYKNPSMKVELMKIQTGTKYRMKNGGETDALFQKNVNILINEDPQLNEGNSELNKNITVLPLINGKAEIKDGRKKIAIIYDRYEFFKGTDVLVNPNDAFKLELPQSGLGKTYKNLHELVRDLKKYFPEVDIQPKDLLLETDVATFSIVLHGPHRDILNELIRTNNPYKRATLKDELYKKTGYAIK